MTAGSFSITSSARQVPVSQKQPGALLGTLSHLLDLPPIGCRCTSDVPIADVGLRHAQTSLDVPEIFPVRKLRDGHTEDLIPAGKRLYPVIAVAALYVLAKPVAWNKDHPLSKNGFSDIQKPSPPASLRKYGLSEKTVSNR